MKNKKLLLFLLILLISGCGSTSSNSSSSSIDSSVTTSSDSYSSVSSSIESNSSSSKPSNTTSSSVVNSSTSSQNSSSSVSQLNTISKIKERAKQFKGLENSVGVYESNVSVTLNLKLLACLDAITTQTGYGHRYKILMTDGHDYIYLKTSYENYDYLKGYVKNQEVYTVTGNISLYNNEVELTVTNKPIYQPAEYFGINYDEFAKLTSLEEVYAEINNLKLNSKGIAFSKLVQIKAKCLAKDINNTNLFFGNGDYIINVHGHDKVTNSFVKGKSYIIVGALSMHNFRPGLEYVISVESDDIEFSTDNLTSMTAADFYKYQYETDEDATYPNYSKLFEKAYVVKGYANVYLKDDKQYMVLEDTYKSNYYSTYQNARSAKAIFFSNENYVGMTNYSTQYCPMYEAFTTGEEIDVIVFPYLWNTQNYPQVYCYSFS